MLWWWIKDDIYEQHLHLPVSWCRSHSCVTVFILSVARLTFNHCWEVVRDLADNMWYQCSCTLGYKDIYWFGLSPNLPKCFHYDDFFTSYFIYLTKQFNLLFQDCKSLSCDWKTTFVLTDYDTMNSMAEVHILTMAIFQVRDYMHSSCATHALLHMVSNRRRGGRFR